ncbi:uncharacterized protein LOC134834234 [Culicoides brevitarsis]|uniref:uncharacterized protein LOC134834234 n=1 Tax=Culicoides brevitarsis TaxID=469753 RepID=UPI00307C2603
MENLPNELFLKIFEFLTTSDRLVISTVSRHWFDLLQLPTFAQDNHIYLNKCLIKKKHPPFRTFCCHKPSNRKFSCLTLNKIHFDRNNLTDVKKFLKTLGKDVLHLTIGLEFDLTIFPNLLNFFPNLKILSLFDCQQLHSMTSAFPDTLETLNVRGLSHNFEFAEINKIPKLKTIKREYVNFYMLTNHVPTGFIPASDELKSLLSALDVHCVIKSNLNYLGTHQITPEFVTHLTCSIAKENFSTIGAKFPNLRSFSVDIATTKDCFFVHEGIEGFKKVHTLILNEQENCDKNPCDKCFETFLETFENLDKFSMHKAINLKLFRIIFEKLQKLRELVLFSPNNENLYDFQVSDLPKITKLKLWSNNNSSLTDEILLNWPKMTSLTNLDIALPMKNIQPASWIRLCQQCPSLTHFTHNCQKYCVNDAILVVMTKLLPKLKYLSLTSAHKLTPISFVSLRNNCPALQTLHLGRNWIDLGTVEALFTQLQQLQHLEWTDAQSYYQQVHTRVDFYEANHLKKAKKVGKNCQERDEESDASSSSDEDDEKKVWGWIPQQGWGFWPRDKVKNVALEPQFDARY